MLVKIIKEIIYINHLWKSSNFKTSLPFWPKKSMVSVVSWSPSFSCFSYTQLITKWCTNWLQRFFTQYKCSDTYIHHQSFQLKRIATVSNNNRTSTATPLKGLSIAVCTQPKGKVSSQKAKQVSLEEMLNVTVKHSEAN